MSQPAPGHGSRPTSTISRLTARLSALWAAIARATDHYVTCILGVLPWMFVSFLAGALTAVVIYHALQSSPP